MNSGQKKAVCTKCGSPQFRLTVKGFDASRESVDVVVNSIEAVVEARDL